MLICEKCKQEHDGSYGSGRFCSQKCAKGFSTYSKRLEINKKVSKTMKGNKYGPGAWTKTKSPRKQKGAVLTVTKTITKEQRVEWAKKGSKVWLKNLYKMYSELPWDDAPDSEKRRRVLTEQDNKCLMCGIDIWNNKPITLHLDHINGKKFDNSRENLRFICPNCHSQTKTYCHGGNKGVSEEDLKEALILHNVIISKALISLNLHPGGGNWKRAKFVIDKYNLHARVA